MENQLIDASVVGLETFVVLLRNAPFVSILTENRFAYKILDWYSKEYGIERELLSGYLLPVVRGIK